MKRGSTLLVGAMAMGWLSQPAEGVVSNPQAGNPYQAIVERNVFDLKEPPVVDPGPPKPPPPPPAVIWLTGITDIRGKKQAFLKVQEPARPPDPAKEYYLNLMEGERQGQIEVLQIDKEAGSVKVSNYGTITNLDFKNNAPKLAAAPAAGVPPVVPGVPRPPGAGGPPGVVHPQAPAVPIPAPTIPTFGGSSGGTALKTIPTRPVRTVASGLPGPTATGPQHAPPQLSAEEQIIMMEVERERTKAAVAAGQLPPLPPTPITPAESMPPMAPPPPAPQ